MEPPIAAPGFRVPCRQSQGAAAAAARLEAAAEAARVEAAEAARLARKRKAEYPDLAVQLDKIYHDGIDKWKTEMVDPVKNAIPKPDKSDE